MLSFFNSSSKRLVSSNNVVNSIYKYKCNFLLVSSIFLVGIFKLYAILGILVGSLITSSSLYTSSFSSTFFTLIFSISLNYLLA